MTEDYDEMRVSPDPSQAEALRQRLHAHMASVSRDDLHGRAQLHVATDHLDPDEFGSMKEIDVSPNSTSSATRNRKLLVLAGAGVVAVIGIAGIALANTGDDDQSPSAQAVTTVASNSDDDQAPSTQAVTTVAPTTTVSSDLSAGTPGLVTGHLEYDEGTTFAVWEEDDVVAGGWRQRGREVHATSEMSDARLSGSVTVTDNADRFMVAGEIIGDVLWGTVVIENDEGTWTGPMTGTSDLSADQAGIAYIELVGAGAYEGLSAILFQRETPTTIDWNGVIFSGNLPPDR